MMAAAEAITLTLNRSGSRRRGGAGDPLLELLLGRGADLARGELAALEHHQRRDRHDAVLLCGLRALVDVELDDLDLAAERAGDLLERRGDHAARPAPLGPEIDHDRLGRLEHLSLEIRVGNLANPHGRPRFVGERANPARERNPNVWTRVRSVKACHAEVSRAISASSTSAESSIRSGTSVQISAARTGRSG